MVLPPVPPVTRLPTDTRRSPIRPSTGARSSLILIEIELGGIHHRLLRGNGGFGNAFGLRALVVGLVGDASCCATEPGRAQIALGEGQVGARLCKIGAHLFERDLERPAVDGEEEVALLHHLAVGEMDARKIAGQPRANLDRIDGDEAADIFVVDRPRCAPPAWRRSPSAAEKLRAAVGRDCTGQGDQKQYGGGQHRETRRRDECHHAALNVSAS